jgi:hypothetical protein
MIPERTRRKIYLLLKRKPKGEVLQTRTLIQINRPKTRNKLPIKAI